MEIKKVALIAGLLGAGIAHAFMPQSGTWVMTSEQNGKPGRGLAIDVQDNTLVLQMYAYEADGKATFYMTSGTIENDSFAAPLNKYKGGRYLGSGDLSGQVDGSPGKVSMRFESGTKGYITLPGEAEKEITRFSFAYGTDSQGLKGIWLFSPLNSVSPVADFIKLERVGAATANGTGVMGTSDGRFGCEHQVSGGAAGTVLCAKVSATGALQRGFQFTYSVNDGEGYYVNSAGQRASIATMRRLGNRASIGTGIVIKSEESDQPSGSPNLQASALQEQIQKLSESSSLQD